MKKHKNLFSTFYYYVKTLIADDLELTWLQFSFQIVVPDCNTVGDLQLERPIKKVILIIGILAQSGH